MEKSCIYLDILLDIFIKITKKNDFKIILYIHTKLSNYIQLQKILLLCDEYFISKSKR